MSTLCLKCFHLVPRGEELVLCTSERCRRIGDVKGDEKPRVMVPKRERGMWRRFPPRVRIDIPCPYCKQIDTIRYACPRCKHELPDTRNADDHLIAVLGAKEAGKTHYLAALYHVLAEAEDPAGDAVLEVELTEERRSKLREEFWHRLFEEQRELPATPPFASLDMHLLLHQRQTDQRILVAFQDLSGEIITDSDLLGKQEFLLHASGVILLADPLALPGGPTRWTRPHHEKLPSCTEVLRGYLSALERRATRVGSRREQEERRLLPEHKVLAVAVSKADLVLRKRSHWFWKEDNLDPLAPGYWDRRYEQSEEARNWLLARTGSELARLASRFADASYFFTSSYGYEHTPWKHDDPPKPRTRTLVKRPTPLRVQEPLFALLDRLGEAQAPVTKSRSSAPRL